MKKTNQAKAIAHYDRMIEWARKQPKHEPSLHSTMLVGIGESWTGKDCVYCQEANKEAWDCDGNCPLYVPYKPHFGCCDGLWSKLNTSSSIWKSWIKNAKKVRAYIKKYGGIEV